MKLKRQTIVSQSMTANLAAIDHYEIYKYSCDRREERKWRMTPISKILIPSVHKQASECLNENGQTKEFR